jgi:hypothetical protein
MAGLWGRRRPLDLIVTMDDATNTVYSALLVEEEGTASAGSVAANLAIGVRYVGAVRRPGRNCRACADLRRSCHAIPIG